MANYPSAKKRIRKSERNRIINKRAVSKVRTLYKKAMETDKLEDAEKIYKDAVSVMDRYAIKGHIHKNNAARKKAQMSDHLNSLKAEA